MLKFLQRIDELLLAQNQRRPWLAQKSGVNLSTINTCFSRDAYPSADKAHALAQALNTTVEFLMTGKQPDPPHEENSLIDEMCEYVRGLARDQLMELRGVLKLFNYMSLRPQKLTMPESEERGAAASR